MEIRVDLGDGLAPISLEQLAAALALRPRGADEAQVRRAEEEAARHDGVRSHLGGEQEGRVVMSARKDAGCREKR